MRLSIIVFMTAFLQLDAASEKIEAYFNETAYLSCPFTNSQNLSLGELVLFWQDQDRLVLHEQYLGREKFDNVNDKYLHRTSFDQDHWTLRLYNVKIKDMGSYQCFVQHKKPTGLIVLYQKSKELLVFANFSEPEIMASNTTKNSGINLTCSSTQGYPKPKRMYFQLITQNSTIEHNSTMQLHQDVVTQLYSVFASFSVPFPNGANNVTVICVLETEPMNRKLFSQHFSIVPEKPSDDTKDSKIWIAAVVVLCIFTVVLIIICIRKKHQRPCLHYKETNKTEREDSEPNEERVKMSVPKKMGEEVQCTVHNLETTKASHMIN